VILVLLQVGVKGSKLLCGESFLRLIQRALVNMLFASIVKLELNAHQRMELHQ